jgi:hypothetical protein
MLGGQNDLGEDLRPVASTVIGDDPLYRGVCRAQRTTSLRVRGIRRTSMDAPASSVGDAPDLLHIHMHHVPRTFRDYQLRRPVRLTVRVDKPAPIEAKLKQEPRDRAPTDRDAFERELELDARR